MTVAGQPYLAITYTRDPGIWDLATSVDWSGDLIQWSRGMTTEISRVPQNGIEVITVRSSQPVSTGPQFLRFTVDEL